MPLVVADRSDVDGEANGELRRPKMRLFLAAVVAIGLTFVAGSVRSAEEKLPLDKLPKAVMETVKKRFPKAELIEATKETDGDKVEYEVSLKVGVTKYDVMFSPDGKITLIEKLIAEKDLPKVVVATLAEKFPKAKFNVVEEMTKVTDGKEVLAYYEVLLETADKKMLEVEIGLDGKIIKTEDKKEEEDKKKDEKKKKK